MGMKKNTSSEVMRLYMNILCENTHDDDDDKNVYLLKDIIHLFDQITDQVYNLLHNLPSQVVFYFLNSIEETLKSIIHPLTGESYIKLDSPIRPLIDSLRIWGKYIKSTDFETSDTYENDLDILKECRHDTKGDLFEDNTFLVYQSFLNKETFLQSLKLYDNILDQLEQDLRNKGFI